MKFERLPNEILIECFEYLEAFHLFHSFNQLNHRFNQLIRNVPLHFNYQHIQKPLYDQFCLTLKDDPEIKQQIISLQLSNEKFPKQIELFLSRFSLNEFPYVQALSLTEMTSENAIQLTPMLPLLSHLVEFRSIKPKNDEQNIISSLPVNELRRLSVRQLSNNLQFLRQATLITHITLSYCTINDVFDVLNNTLVLKYLNIKNISSANTDQSIHSLPSHSYVHLKRLIIMNYNCDFGMLEHLLRQTSNLYYLTIVSNYNEEIIDAFRWEYLIRSSLPRLIHFTFDFYCNWNSDIPDRFKQFQTSFWYQEHSWYTTYAFNRYYGTIHTIPSVQDEYTLRTPLIKYEYTKPNTFENVKKLNLSYEVMTHSCLYYFSNVTSLILRRHIEFPINLSSQEIFEFVQSVVNLFNLQYLSISNCATTDMMMILLEILKRAPRLTSLHLESFDIYLTFNNKELYNYLNKMIRIIEFNDSFTFTKLEEVRLFCEIFSNIKQLTCNIDDYDYLLYLLDNLPYLIYLEIRVLSHSDSKNFLTWFNTQTFKANTKFTIEEIAARRSIGKQRNEKCFSIWIEQNVECFN